MKNKNYQLISSTIDNKYKKIEKMTKPSSVEFWTKMAQRDERFGCSVNIKFEYNTSSKEVVMMRYESICKKSNDKIIIRLLKKIA